MIVVCIFKFGLSSLQFAQLKIFKMFDTILRINAQRSLHGLIKRTFVGGKKETRLSKIIRLSRRHYSLLSRTNHGVMKNNKNNNHYNILGARKALNSKYISNYHNNDLNFFRPNILQNNKRSFSFSNCCNNNFNNSMRYKTKNSIHLSNFGARNIGVASTILAVQQQKRTYNNSNNNNIINNNGKNPKHSNFINLKNNHTMFENAILSQRFFVSPPAMTSSIANNNGNLSDSDPDSDDEGSNSSRKSTNSNGGDQKAGHAAAAASAQVLFDLIFEDLIQQHGTENLRFPKDIMWLAGAPGSGKGEMTKFIMEQIGNTNPPIMMSNILEGSALAATKASGGLVSDRIVLSTLFQRLLLPMYQTGVIVDGYVWCIIILYFVFCIL